MKSIVSFLTALSIMLITFASCNASPSEHITDKASKEFMEDVQTQQTEAVLVDVRTPGEFEAGALDGALNINVTSSDFMDKFQEAVPNKDQTIYLYCKSGNRSKKAAIQLEKAGYTNLINATSGYQALSKYEK